MKTLSKEYTRTFFKKNDGFARLEAIWKARLESKEELCSADHLLYQVLRGKNWAKGFTPTTRQVELDNGAHPWEGARTALYRLKSYSTNVRSSYLEPYADILVEDIGQRIGLILPSYAKVKDLYEMEPYDVVEAPAPTLTVAEIAQPTGVKKLWAKLTGA